MIYTKPFLYQEDTVEKIQEDFQGRALVAHEPGLGKTLVALLWAHDYLQQWPMLVVCPASLKWNWKHEARKHLGMKALVLEGTRPEPDLLYGRHKIIIINYDILKPWSEHLLDTKPGLLVVDESHALQSRSSLRTKECRKLSQNIPNMIALSGTPLVNRPAELWPVLNMLRPGLYRRFWNFAQDFCAPKKTIYGWDVRGASNLDKLHEQLTSQVMTRKLKREVMDQLPAKARHVVHLEIQDRKQYHRAIHGFLDWLRTYNPAKLGKAKQAQALVKLGYVKRLIAKLKYPSVADWIDNFLVEGNEKIIVFAIHRKMLDRLQEHYQGMNVRVDGSVTGQKRQLAFDQFVKDPRIRVFLGNIRAAGQGWSALGCSTVCFTELDWTPGAHLQAEDRTHGIGRGQKGIASSSYYLIAEGTMEEELCKLIYRKQLNLTKTLDGESNGRQLDVLEELLLELKSKHRRPKARKRSTV